MNSNIRQERVRQFLRTHTVLCLIALITTTVETISGVQPNIVAILGSYAISVGALLMTFVAFRIYRNSRFTNKVAPVILALDSVMILVQLLSENGLESGWAATPIFATILMPLYSDDRRLIWGLAGFQIAAYMAVYGLRAAEIVEYTQRPANADTYLYSTIGFILTIVGAAVFAGQASLDVLNSQKRLKDEIDAATAELKRTQAKLAQQEKMAGLGQLTAGVAHEINNPLTFVQTNLTSIERDMRDVFGLVQAFEPTLPMLAQMDPSKAAELEQLRDEIGFDDEMIEMLGELMDDARDGLERVQRIIGDLRTFSRPGTAQLQAIDLKQAAEQAIKQFQKVAQVPVEEVYEPVGAVAAYPMLLNQVLINLLRNARDAMPAENGRIIFRTRPAVGGVYIEVQDNGPGVPQDIRDRVFDPFFTTKEVGEGTGLGLSITYQIVEHHQGRVEIHDAPNGGALFRIWLPDDGDVAPKTRIAG